MKKENPLDDNSLELRRVEQEEASGSGEQGEYDNDRFQDTSFIDGQGSTEAGGTPGARAVETLGTQVDPLSKEQTTQGVDRAVAREAAAKHQNQAFEGDTSFMDRYIRHTDIPEFAEFIKKEYGENGLYLGEDDAIEYRNFLLHVKKTNNGNITYNAIGKKGRRIARQVVLKRNASGVLEFNSVNTVKYTVDRFRTELGKFVDTSRRRRKTVRELEARRYLVDTTPNTSNIEAPTEDVLDQNSRLDGGGAEQVEVINGILPEETRELRGVLFPTGATIASSRIGQKRALQIQADHFSETIESAESELNEVKAELSGIRETHAEGGELRAQTRRQLELEEKQEELEKRIEGLEEARDLTLRQKELEETRAGQEKDITRLQEFKKWAKRNMAIGIGGLPIGIAGLITTIIIAARKAILKGAQGVSKFSRAVANLGKKLWPLLAPIFIIISQILSWGAKGLAFLSSNLWILAIAFAWFIYDQYKERRR